MCSTIFTSAKLNNDIAPILECKFIKFFFTKLPLFRNNLNIEIQQ